MSAKQICCCGYNQLIIGQVSSATFDTSRVGYVRSFSFEHKFSLFISQAKNMPTARADVYACEVCLTTRDPSVTAGGPNTR